MDVAVDYSSLQGLGAMIGSGPPHVHQLFPRMDPGRGGGGGKVGMHASRMDGKVRIDVSDTGLGIRAENLPHIFDEFFREKRKETRDIQGNGLGLAIVRMLVERSSGKIEVQSTEGVGSTFSVYLPMSPPA